MTVKGEVKNGVVVLSNPAALPEGAQVSVTVLRPRKDRRRGLRAILLRHAGKGKNLPADLAAQHDHYAHGKPKR